MNKIFILLFCVFFLSACNKTQLKEENNRSTNTEIAEIDEDGSIPRNILGCKLGETGMAHAAKILKEQGYKVKERTEDGCACLDVEGEINCMGEKWPLSMFLFLDNKLVRVFLIDEKNVDKLECREYIKERYSEYLFIEEDKNVYANDDNTSLRLIEEGGAYPYAELRVTDYLRNSELPMHADNINSPF